MWRHLHGIQELKFAPFCENVLENCDSRPTFPALVDFSGFDIFFAAKQHGATPWRKRRYVNIFFQPVFLMTIVAWKLNLA